MSESHARSHSFTRTLALASHVSSIGPEPQWMVSEMPQAPLLHDTLHALSSLQVMLVFTHAFVPEQVTSHGHPSGQTIALAELEQRFAPTQSNWHTPFSQLSHSAGHAPVPGRAWQVPSPSSSPPASAVSSTGPPVLSSPPSEDDASLELLVSAGAGPELDASPPASPPASEPPSSSELASTSCEPVLASPVLVELVPVDPVVPVESFPELDEVDVEDDPPEVLLPTIVDDVEPALVEVVVVSSSSSGASPSLDAGDPPSSSLVESSSSFEPVPPNGSGPGSFLQAPIRPTHRNRVPSRRIITSRFIVPRGR